VPVHVEDLGGRTKEILGRAVAIKAPLHAERLGLVDLVHLVDRPVAAVAADSAVHMDRMIEVGVVGQSVNLHPGDRLARLPALADRSETGAVRKDLAVAVTVDAGLSGGKVRVAGNLDKAMAVTAIHPELLHMEGVGEGHRLIRLITDAGILGGEIIPDPEGDGRAHNQPANQQLER
jgi:hypothetical protein